MAGDTQLFNTLSHSTHMHCSWKATYLEVWSAKVALGMGVDRAVCGTTCVESAREQQSWLCVGLSCAQ